MRGVEIEGDKARAEAGALAEDVGDAAIKTGHVLHARHLPQRRGGRVHARRRAELARPQARLGLQQGERDRAGNGRRRGPHGRRRRATPTSSGRCAGAAGDTRSSPPCTSSCCRSGGLRRRPAVPGRGRERRGAAPIATGRRAPPRRSAACCACSTCRRFPTSRSRSAARSFWGSRPPASAARQEGEKAIAPLREIGEPVMDTFAQVPAPALTRIAMDPEPPVPGLGHHGVLSELPDEAVDAFVRGRRPGVGLTAAARGAPPARRRAGAPAENGGALDKLDGEFVLLGIGMLMDPAMREPIAGQLDKLTDAMKPWSAEGGYFNYAERPCDVEAILPAATCERLRTSSAAGTRTTSSWRTTRWRWRRRRPGALAPRRAGADDLPPLRVLDQPGLGESSQSSSASASPPDPRCSGSGRPSAA